MADDQAGRDDGRRGRHGLPGVRQRSDQRAEARPKAARPPAAGMPKLVRFVMINSVIGVLIGWAIAAALLWFNISGLGDMFMRSDSKPVIVALMGMSFGVTFGFAYLSTAVMLLPTRKDDFDRL